MALFRIAYYYVKQEEWSQETTWIDVFAIIERKFQLFNFKTRAEIIPQLQSSIFVLSAQMQTGYFYLSAH